MTFANPAGFKRHNTIKHKVQVIVETPKIVEVPVSVPVFEQIVEVTRSESESQNISTLDDEISFNLSSDSDVLEPETFDITEDDEPIYLIRPRRPRTNEISTQTED